MPVTIEATTRGQLFVKPLNRSIRSRFSAASYPGGHKLLDQWPEPIPGQRIEFDPKTCTAAIIEPLHQHASYRAKIQQRGEQLEPERQEIAVDDPKSFTYHIMRAVQAGHAAVVDGSLPSKLPEGDDIRKNYREPVRPKPVDPFTRLAQSLDQQTQVLARLVPAAK